MPGDFSDYVADLQIAQQNLKAAGIDLQLNKVSDDDWRADRAGHNFDLIMTGGFFGPTPYYDTGAAAPQHAHHGDRRQELGAVERPEDGSTPGSVRLDL